jgi:hypothetical protein
MYIIRYLSGLGDLVDGSSTVLAVLDDVLLLASMPEV